MDPIIYTPAWGEHLAHAIRWMYLVANANNAEVQMEFNEETVTIRPGDNPEEVICAYQEKISNHGKEQRNSPEHTAYQEAIKKQKYAQHKKLLTLCKEKPDFDSLESCIDWFDALSKLDLLLLSHLPVAGLFQKHGYRSNVFIGKDFNPEDKEVFARWLIGQALHCIETVGTIYPMFSEHAAFWKEKFNTKR